MSKESELAALEKELHEWLTHRPEMPRPFHKDSPEAIKWQAAFQKWVNTKELLIRDIQDRRPAVRMDRPPFNPTPSKHPWRSKDAPPSIDPLGPGDGPSD